MIVLAIDTSAEFCAVCLRAGDGAVLARASERIGRGHGEILLPMIEKALADAKLTFADIGRIGVAVGPGSFTGVRVGVAAARGLALALSCEIVGVTNLEALAHEAAALHPGRDISVAIDARRGQFYLARFDPAGRPVSEPSLEAYEGFDRTTFERAGAPLIAGSAGPLLRSDDVVLADASTASIDTIAALAAAKPKPSGKRPVPFYLRAADAKPTDPTKLVARRHVEKAG